MVDNKASIEKYLSSSKTLTSLCLDPTWRHPRLCNWELEVEGDMDIWEMEGMGSSSWSSREGGFYAISWTPVSPNCLSNERPLLIYHWESKQREEEL